MKVPVAANDRILAQWVTSRLKAKGFNIDILDGTGFGNAAAYRFLRLANERGMNFGDMTMVSSYDNRLVVLSVLIAIFASYAGLDLAGRVTATDGLEAWKALQGSDAPELAVLDWMMLGMDGVEVRRKSCGKRSLLGG
jgi:hypothetical protein